MSDLKILDHLHEPVLAINKEHKVTYFNQSATVFFQTPPRIFKGGLNPDKLFVEEDQWPFDLVRDAFRDGDAKISQEMTCTLAKSKNQKVHFIVKIVPLPASENVALLFFRDMTVEKHLYEKYKTQMRELEDGHAQIIQADKLATLGEMTASISHEIANPLTIASGNLEVSIAMMDSPPGPEEFATIKQCVGDAFDSITRINDIILNMKSYLHKNEDKKEYVDLKVIFEEVLALIRPALKESQIEFQVQTPEDEIVAFVNPTKISQVALNLVKNAMDALNEDKQSGGKKLSVILSKNQTNGAIWIQVQDNGKGIPDKLKEQVFKPFFTTKTIGEGTGLGLAICQKIILAHNGKIWFENLSEGGCCFNVELPGVEVSSYTHNERYLSGLADHPGIKVLALDDEPQVLNVLNHLLSEEKDFVFIGSTKVEDALRIIQKFGVDVVLADVNMPKRGGLDLAQEFKNHPAPPIFLLMTGGKIEEDVYKKLQLPFVRGPIKKPFNGPEVRKAIRNAISSKRK